MMDHIVQIKSAPTINDALQMYIPILKMIRGQFGNSCETILYDMEDLEHSVIAVSGNVSDQTIGSPLPEYIRELMCETDEETRDQYGFINKSVNHLALRTSVMFIRNSYGKIIGCMALNYNIIHFKMVVSFLEEFSRSFDPNEEDEQNLLDLRSTSYTAENVEQFLENVLSDYLRDHLANNSFDMLDRMERISLIRGLDERGIFLVKGAVNTVAKHLRISKFTVYSYLDEIRSEPSK